MPNLRIILAYFHLSTGKLGRNIPKNSISQAAVRAQLRQRRRVGLAGGKTIQSVPRQCQLVFRGFFCR